ncbi:hypothetical protein SMG44B_60168 [Stenotrophomonas maltophilia]
MSPANWVVLRGVLSPHGTYPATALLNRFCVASGVHTRD